MLTSVRALPLCCLLCLSLMTSQGFASMVFDTIFMIQHWVCFRGAAAPSAVLDPEPLLVNDCLVAEHATASSAAQGTV